MKILYGVKNVTFVFNTPAMSWFSQLVDRSSPNEVAFIVYAKMVVYEYNGMTVISIVKVGLWHASTKIRLLI